MFELLCQSICSIQSPTAKARHEFGKNWVIDKSFGINIKIVRLLDENTIFININCIFLCKCPIYFTILKCPCLGNKNCAKYGHFSGWELLFSDFIILQIRNNFKLYQKSRIGNIWWITLQLSKVLISLFFLFWCWVSHRQGLSPVQDWC